jgi:SAM-dependent methyltransferase
MHSNILRRESLEYELGSDGVYRPKVALKHRGDEYDQQGFETLWKMQDKHFWYRGRHRFLLAAVNRARPVGPKPWTAMDLGGGLGGWLRYLVDHSPGTFRSLALADSSDRALHMASAVLPGGVARYQIDLMNLGWEAQCDVAFLLDVIEHLPDDVQVMRQAAQALKPGGLLFVTTPALKQFWSYNDDIVHHLRRYSRKDYAALAQATGLELLDARYFMFLLSPLYWLTRRRRGVRDMSAEQQRELLQDSHKVPSAPLNLALTVVFGAETPLGHWLRFPWGTSILGVFRKV